ncbi:helix-turn-helix domain-containing protein [Nocardia aobensis]|uniref:Helix-turn-helix domain-containing protein n=1 Tax=Nocardia aobensis TaxID=257277 RepID=A0ABW6P347_9NOCA
MFGNEFALPVDHRGARPDRYISVGEFIQMRRKERRLSRRVVANLVGRSEEWLRLVETGRQALDSITLILALADVLHIDDVSMLIAAPDRHGHGSFRPAEPLESAARAIVHALYCPPAALTGPQEINAADVAEEVRQCRAVWLSSPQRYRQLTARLPGLIASGRRLRLRREAADTRAVVAQIYNLASQVLLKMQQHPEALLAADRACENALLRPRSVETLLGTWHFASALLHAAASEEALRVAAAVTGESSLGDLDRSEDRVVVAGAITLVAARAAAALSDVDRREKSLTMAVELAERIGTNRCVQGVFFGPAEVGLARMEIALAEQNPHAAVAVAAETELPDDCPLNSRSRYHMVLARSFALTRQDVAAAYELIKAAGCGEDELRYDVDAPHTFQLLLHREDPLVRREVSRLTSAAGLVSATRPRTQAGALTGRSSAC